MEGFRWTNPLWKLYEDKKNSACSPFDNIYLDYEEQLFYLITIWDRLKEDYRNFDKYSDFHRKIVERAITSPGKSYRLSPEESQESSNLRRWELVLMLDYESFFIFSRILMDKLAKVATCIINEGANLIPKDSFTNHKKYFLKEKNKPYPLNERYAKLIREKTEWYDLSLLTIRDKVISHGNARIRSMPFYREAGDSRSYLRPSKRVKISSFTKESDKIIEIKKKYESEYPDLEKIVNPWEVLDYFLSNNIKLSTKDKSEVVQIISSTGTNLPDLRILADNIKKLLHDFCEALQ